MRIILAALVIAAFSWMPVLAADDGAPLAGKMPDNGKSQQVYLFMLKKNGISLRISPQQFCGDLGYGTAATRSDDPTGKRGFWEQGNEELDKEGKSIMGELAWVICEFPGTPLTH